MIVDCILAFRYPVKLLRKEEKFLCKFKHCHSIVRHFGICGLCGIWLWCICGQLRFVVKIVKFFILFIYFSLATSFWWIKIFIIIHHIEWKNNGRTWHGNQMCKHLMLRINKRSPVCGRRIPAETGLQSLIYHLNNKRKDFGLQINKKKCVTVRLGLPNK